MRTLHRRAVLAGALGVATQVALAPAVRAATRKAAAGVTALTPDVAVIDGVGANVLVLTSADGALLVDTGSVQRRGELRAQLGRLPGKGRVQTVINTHWHREQTGNNELFGKAGATIIAHHKTRQRLATDVWRPEEQSYLPALPKSAWPTRAFHRSEVLEHAGEQVECGYLLEAHTDGDIYVLLRKANVLAVGDVLAAPDRDPELDWFGGGWLGGRIDALAALLKVANDATRIVPAQGPVQSRLQLQAEYDALAPLFDRLAVMLRKGFTTDDMIAANVLESTGRRWQDGARFLYSAHKGLWAHHNTLSHDIV